MRAIEFTYWLQGAFEIGNFEKLDKEQLDIVKKHLLMVSVTENKKMNSFCHWLEGFLAFSDSKELSISNTLKLRSKLNECFEHVVSIETPKKSILLNPNSESLMIRC